MARSPDGADKTAKVANQVRSRLLTLATTMSTLPVHFKLVKPGDATRKVSFPDNPTWLDLAAKVEELFRVPPEHLALVYTDNEGDKITLSSQEELTEFYTTATGSIRFVVRDLAASHEPSAAGDDDDHSHLGVGFKADGKAKSPFLGAGAGSGIPLMFDFADDGFHIPIDALLRAKAGSAYFEELGTVSRHSTPAHNDADGKGKGRAADADEVLSAVSMDGTFAARGDEQKPPVHVFDAKRDVTVTIEEQKDDPGSFLKRVLDLGRREKDPAPDPPLAPIEDAAPKPPPKSLVRDLADLVQQLSRTVASHPELSEGVRNVLQNVSDGAYWSDASGQLVNETDEARAGMRLADSIGDLFKTIGGLTAEEIARRAAHAQSHPYRHPRAAPPPPPEGRRGGWDRVRDRVFPGGVPRPPGAPGQSFYPRNAYFAPPPPPPPPPPPGMPRYAIAPGPPPPPPVGRFDPFNPANIAALRRANMYAGPPSGPAPPPPPQQYQQPPPPPPAPVVQYQQPQIPQQPTQAPPAAPLAPEARKAQLEAAKQLYVQQKEAWRREKEERRREKERLARERSGFAALSATRAPADEEDSEVEKEPAPRKEDCVPIVTPPPLAPLDHIPADDASEPRAQPTLQRAPADVVPERTRSKMEFNYKFMSPTPTPVIVSRGFGLPGSGNRVHAAAGRITARLADMGFTRETYPDVAERVARQLSASVHPTSEAEDAIVVRLLEELIASRASGSGAQATA